MGQLKNSVFKIINQKCIKKNLKTMWDLLIEDAYPRILKGTEHYFLSKVNYYEIHRQ